MTPLLTSCKQKGEIQVFRLFEFTQYFTISITKSDH
jgi:hypothetical protein